jgi:hypothetical protein
MSTSPNNPKVFFIYTHRTCGRGVSTPYSTALTSLPGIFMHPHRMDDRGSAKHLWATTGVSTHRQPRARDTPVALVAGCCLLVLLASGLGSSVGAPSTTDPLIHCPLISARYELLATDGLNGLGCELRPLFGLFRFLPLHELPSDSPSLDRLNPAPPITQTARASSGLLEAPTAARRGFSRSSIVAVTVLPRIFLWQPIRCGYLRRCRCLRTAAQRPSGEGDPKWRGQGPQPRPAGPTPVPPAARYSIGLVELPHHQPPQPQ